MLATAARFVVNFGANSISLLINDGSGFFSVVRTVSGQQGAKGLAVGDWDGDGIDTVAMWRPSAGTLHGIDGEVWRAPSAGRPIVGDSRIGRGFGGGGGG